MQLITKIMAENSQRPPMIFLPILALGGIYFAASIIPIDRLWGFNLLKFYSIPFQIGMIVLLAAISVAAISEWLGRAIIKANNLWEYLPRVGRMIVIALITFIVFYVLRVHVHSLGDGYQRINQIEKGFYFYHTELLDFFLHAVLYRISNLFAKVSGESIYAFYSMICGTIFVTVIYLFKFPESWKDESSSYIKWLIISMGGIQLFFGYAESYSLYYPMSLIYILMAVKYLETGRGIIGTTVVYIFIPFIHLTGIFLLPSFLYILFQHYRNSNQLSQEPGKVKISIKRHLPLLMFTVSMALLCTMALLAEKRGQTYSSGFANKALPIFSTNPYSVFSFSHLLDILNELLLVMPAPLILLYYLSRRKKEEHKANEFYFLGIIALSAVLFLLFLDPRLGFARDWDLFSIPAASVGLAIILYRKFNSHADGQHALLRSLLFVSIIFSGIWVMANSSTNTQLTRAEELLKLSDRERRYGTELLAQYYFAEAGNIDKGLELLKSIPDNMKNAHVYSAIAKAELDLEHFGKALQDARRSIQIDSLDPLPHFVAGSALIGMDSSGSAIPYFLAAERLAPNDPKILNMLGRAYMGVGDYNTAGQSFRRIIQFDPKFPVAYFNLGFLFYRTGHLDSAYFYTARGLEIDSSDAIGRQLMNSIIKRAQESGRQ